MFQSFCPAESASRPRAIGQRLIYAAAADIRAGVVLIEPDRLVEGRGRLLDITIELFGIIFTLGAEQRRLAFQKIQRIAAIPIVEIDRRVVPYGDRLLGLAAARKL